MSTGEEAAAREETTSTTGEATDSGAATGTASETDQTTAAASEGTPETVETTTVTVVCTGQVRRAVGKSGFAFAFAGDTLRAFLAAFFEEHPVEELLLAETEAEATATGWADPPDELPGTWRANPEGEQTRAYARVLVNGLFNEHREGLDTPLSDGDRVALVYPFIYCC